MIGCALMLRDASQRCEVVEALACVNLSALPDIHVLLSSSAKDRMARELGRLAAAARANIHATSFYFARV